jgi:TRAP-type C4-dicarboxylate transport system substrate-binding protein
MRGVQKKRWAGMTARQRKTLQAAMQNGKQQVNGEARA